MAYVVARPHGRWEIRESHLTESGPRARTLTSFRTLSPEVLERAKHAARSPFNLERVIRSARKAGARFETSDASRLAGTLLNRLCRGDRLRPGLQRLLASVLEAKSAATADSLGEWIGASLEERGATLVDLLGLADSIPHERPGPLLFPRLSAPEDVH